MFQYYCKKDKIVMYIGLSLLLCSLLLMVFNYNQIKVNINKMTVQEIEIKLDNINGIGKETKKIILREKSEGKVRLDELSNFNGIGEEKVKILNHHFKSEGMYMRDIWFNCSLIAQVILMFLGTTVIMYGYLRKVNKKLNAFMMKPFRE